MMEDLINNTFSIALLTGTIFLMAGAVMYLYPPKKINHLYGYRTPSSMKSQERWEFAQHYSAVLMMKVALSMIVLSFAGKFFDSPEVQMIGGFAILMFGVAWLFIGTERQLKKRF